MNLPATVYAFRWFVRDTIRQAGASRLSWLTFALSGTFIAICFSVGIHGDTPLQDEGETLKFLPTNAPQNEVARSADHGVAVLHGELTLLFGIIRVPIGRDGREAVHFLQLLLAGGVADSLGILLALVWSAGFLPVFLEPASASVLLAKPVPRWVLLIGKYVGVLAFVAIQASVFVCGTWCALGVRTGIWDGAYLFCVPLLILHFAIFFGVSALLAVCTRNTVVCVFASVLFWFACWGMNYGRHVAVLTPEADRAASGVLVLVDAGYWILPKPADLGIVLFDTLQAGNSFQRLDVFQALDKQGGFDPLLSLASSLTFALVVLTIAGRRFARLDY